VSTSRATVTSLATISRRAILASGAMLALGACRRLAPSAARGERVVVLSPALAATLKDLGVSDLVVGRHGWDMALDPGLPVCGDQSGIDYEALLAAHPTVVIIELNPRDVPDRLVELARTNGWELLNLPALGLDDVVRVTRTLEDRFSPGAGLADRLAGLSGGRGGAGAGGAGDADRGGAADRGAGAGVGAS
jgi:ABC-type Fe3+-hydroxamate transport system substrate-binding protein